MDITEKSIIECLSGFVTVTNVVAVINGKRLQSVLNVFMGDRHHLLTLYKYTTSKFSIIWPFKILINFLTLRRL